MYVNPFHIKGFQVLLYFFYGHDITMDFHVLNKQENEL
ncbi:hypothetical protein MC28_F043 (plasmid) [Bacillus thuringiensis MC28]|nr:hypothetical protein MC28_F043 [Bacillus thuringiensis MC28]